MQTADAQTEPALPEKKLPMPGEVFRVEGRTAFVIPPDKKSDNATPWVWYAPTLPGLPGTEERWMFERFAKAGIAVAGIEVGERQSSKTRRRHTENYPRRESMTQLQQEHEGYETKSNVNNSLA